MSASDIMVVSAAAGALCYECSHVFDGREGARCARFFGGGHDHVRERSVESTKQKTTEYRGGVDKCTVGQK